MIETVEDARFLRGQEGWVYLEVTLNGIPVTIIPEQLKYTLVDQGLVYIGASFEDDPDYRMVAVVDVDFDPKYIPVRGFTNDSRVVRLARKLLRMANDEEASVEGPVEI